MSGKLTQVDGGARTFIAMPKGKAITFSAAELSKLPTVGKMIDITYTGTPSGPMEVKNFSSSRSNAY